MTAQDRDRRGPSDPEIRRVLEERAEALAQAIDHVGERIEGLDLMTFRVGTAHYGIPIELVREVQPLDSRTWSRIPCTPSYVIGAVNIRGHIYSIVDIAAFIGGATPSLSDTPHVLLVAGGRAASGEPLDLCIISDALPVTRTVPEEDVKPSPEAVPERARAFVRGVTPDMLLLLDLDRLLSTPNLVVNDEL